MSRDPEQFFSDTQPLKMMEKSRDHESQNGKESRD